MTSGDDNLMDEIETLCSRARAACGPLAVASSTMKNDALIKAAEALRVATVGLIEANANDVGAAKAAGRPNAFLDRLSLDAARVEAMANSLEAIAALPDPVGRDLGSSTRPNGLVIERVAVPIGVIAMIYESRPNVGADAGGLCLKSGNAVILRGGSDSARSSAIIIDCMRAGLKAAGLPEDAVQMVRTADRQAVGQLLRASGRVDLAIPRGGRSLVELVRDEARVPTLLHLDGNCHTYVHESADLVKACEVIRNAKLRRTGICGACESLLVDRSIAAKAIPQIADVLDGVEIRGDAAACALDDRIDAADDDDWGTEYLDAILSLKVVDGMDAALNHLARYSSNHTDAIIAEDQAAADHFLMAVDSAVVMHNASTQFSDGGEFGMGAEIGIATGKMHARGPVGLEQLTSFKYRVRGDGQIRA